jgi:hypothetical protein
MIKVAFKKISGKTAGHQNLILYLTTTKDLPLVLGRNFIPKVKNGAINT